MTTTPQTAPFDRIDELTAHLGSVQTQLLGIFAQSNQRHQAIDAEYAPEVNPLLKDAQDTFNELQRLCEAHRTDLLPTKGAKPAKNAKRNTGTVGWRAAVRVVTHVPDEDLVARLRAMSPAISRRFVRRTVRHELNRDALAYVTNRKLVETIDGVELDTSDDFYAVPSAGMRMSTAKPYWPRLEGLPGPLMLNAVLNQDTDA